MEKLTIELATGKRSIRIPESWKEIDLATFIRIENEFGYDFKKLITLFSIVTGIDMAPIEESEQTDLDVQLFNILNYIAKPPKWESLEKPKKLTINRKAVECKYDFKTTSLGQKLLMTDLIRDKPNPIDAIPEVIAIFLQPTIDGKFNKDKMKALVPGILKLNCIDAYGYAQFFFLHSKHLKMYGQKDSEGKAQKKSSTRKWQEINASDLSLQ